MPRFYSFNTENKLRIPLTDFAAEIIENDCLNFSLKKTTLINSIILNYYQRAECSISLRLHDRQEELRSLLKSSKTIHDDKIIVAILRKYEEELIDRYTQRQPADVNWQVTLNKKTKSFLTDDSSAPEEIYYGDKPGRYVRALIEEYTHLPYYIREEIIFKKTFDLIRSGIRDQLALKLTTSRGTQILVKPYDISLDPLSMYHYLIGYNTESSRDGTEGQYVKAPVLSIRIARLTDVEILYHLSGILSPKEKSMIRSELKTKSVQFVSGKKSLIKVRLTDFGIKKYNNQIHLRPAYVGKDPSDDHIYLFECTEDQIMYYFFSFGKEAKVIEPESLAARFIEGYKGALALYSDEA